VSATLQASAVVSSVDETPVEAHLRRVLDTQPVPLSRVSVDGIFLAVNDAALSMLGAERLEQVLDTSLLDMVARGSRESCRVFLSRVAAGDRGSTEVEFTGLGGLAHTLQLHATTHPMSPDGTSSVLVTLRDITEYRRLEHTVVDAAARDEQRAAAHAAEVARLSTQIADSHTNATARSGDEARTAALEQQLADAERKHHDAAERHAVLQAQARAEVQAAQEQLEATIAEHLSRLTEVEGALRTAEARERKMAEQHEADSGALRLALKAQDDNARQVEELRAANDSLEQHRAKLRAGNASLETERDELNSQLVMAGHERLAWSARLDHAELLARAGRLSLSFADDIGTALKGVADYGRLLMGDAGQGVHRESLDQMLAAATVAQALVRQLRHGARRVEVDPLEISPVIHSLKRSLVALLSPDITLSILAGAEGARVGLTSQQVEQVALTLAANRRAAMVKGGQVTIELAEVDIDEACARERMASPGPYVLLAVHAAGPEVEHGIAPQLFGIPANEDTWQTAGPGMSALYAMVNEWGGCLWASQEGPDALAFEILLPRVMAGRDASADGAQR
jgi:PAS domain S-box-containing protein